MRLLLTTLRPLTDLTPYETHKPLQPLKAPAAPPPPSPAPPAVPAPPASAPRCPPAAAVAPQAPRAAWRRAPCRRGRRPSVAPADRRASSPLQNAHGGRRRWPARGLFRNWPEEGRSSMRSCLPRNALIWAKLANLTCDFDQFWSYTAPREATPMLAGIRVRRRAVDERNGAARIARRNGAGSSNAKACLGSDLEARFEAAMERAIKMER